MNNKRRNQFSDYIEEISMMKPCEFCTRLISLGRGRKEDEPDVGTIYESSCEAYPDGIPDMIYSGFWNHEKPYDGDNGVLFDPIETKKVLDGVKYKIGWKGIPK